ncbi:MAG: hypothetical protein ACRC1R_00430 [Cetobacterium sp.]|uniref:hypothetical protein n=1 Tax=Cetobacterium sp. TaxID=2071632 RepID=UPI003F39D21F
MKTEKLYYKNPLQTSCEAVVIEKHPQGLIFDKTVAYPEGGGQVGDVGFLTRTSDNFQIPFFNTTKIKGRNIFLEDFPSIKVETLIIHHIDESFLEKIEEGDIFILEINKKNRSQNTLHHSALHLALMALEDIKPGIDQKIIGAKITDKYGRLDFAIDYKFSPELLKTLEDTCNKYIEENIPVEIYSHPKEPEALYWKCKNYSVPCGGTHCESTGNIGVVKIKRKSIGKYSERLIVEVPENNNFLNSYK